MPTDGSEGANAVAEHTVDIASRYDATLYALYVADVRTSTISTETYRDEVIQLLDQSGERPTTPVLDQAEGKNIPTTEAIRLGVSHEIIREYIDENDIDLVVMRTHSRTGLEHTLLGSTTERIARTVDVPVLTVHLDPNQESKWKVSGLCRSESVS